jgi:hypothetical protein
MAAPQGYWERLPENGDACTMRKIVASQSILVGAPEGLRTRPSGRPCADHVISFDALIREEFGYSGGEQLVA